MKQRSISWGELAVLQDMFAEQTAGHEWRDDDDRAECEYDFVEQYINGNDDPKVRYL